MRVSVSASSVADYGRVSQGQTYLSHTGVGNPLNGVVAEPKDIVTGWIVSRREYSSRVLST
jgi:hypothetical protein